MTARTTFREFTPNKFKVLGKDTALLCDTPSGATVSVLVNTSDLKALLEFSRWKVYTFTSRGTYKRIYAVTHKDKRFIYMHRHLMNADQYPELVVDHVNRRGTDNRRCNLRLVPSRINMLNSQASHKSPHGRSVSLTRNNTFQAIVGGRYLGTFKTAPEAQAAVREYLKSQGVSQ